MMDKKKYSLFGFLCAAVITAAMVTVFAQEVKAELVALDVADCVKCHVDAPASIASNGGKHQTAVTCLDCHGEHPPWGKMSYLNVRCAMKAGPILNWRTAFPAIPIPMSLLICNLEMT